MSDQIITKVEDLKQKLIDVINNAGLHIALVKPIIQEINILINQQYEKIYKAELEQCNKDRENEEPEQYRFKNKEIKDDTPK